MPNSRSSVDTEDPPFSRLPAELRLRIYEELYAAHPASGCTRKLPLTVTSLEEPAITRVSRGIRLEALPLFYQSSRFLLSSTSIPVSSKGRLQRAQSTTWLNKLGPGHLRRVCKLDLYVRFGNKHLGDALVDVRFYIDIDWRTKSYTVAHDVLPEFCFDQCDDLGFDYEAKIVAVELYLREKLDAEAGSPLPGFSYDGLRQIAFSAELSLAQDL